jgi:hypothetical protein
LSIAKPLHHSLPKSVTLNGADAFFIMLEKSNNLFSKGNNVVRMCITCNTLQNAHVIEQKLTNSALVHWMCNLQLKNENTVFFKPKWWYKDKGKTLSVHQHLASNTNDPLSKIINRPLNIKKGELVTCDRVLLESGETMLVLSWHHALMDGRGSGHFIRGLFDEKIEWKHFFPRKEKEPSLYAYIRNMYKVKRFIQHSSRFPIGAVRKWNTQQAEKHPISKFFSHSFTSEETKLIDEKAVASGSRFGSANFLLACCAVAVHRLRKDKGVEGDLWIPVPYDGRKRGGVGPLISNQIAFLFYRLTSDELCSVDESVRSIHNQMMEQLKMDMPQKYNQLLDMMRYIPLSLYQYLTTKSSEGRVASFLFSSAGQDKWDLSNLTNNHIKSIQLIPPATVPPGLTFNFLRNENCLTLNLLWSTAVLNDQECEELKQVMLQLMTE